ncbi:GNAT family N-acetyltransferase [Aurantiacibacter spongiae]|uniref:N-acetyltransferase n=1 Tax=Aurantiacibacter spongiae TaxID=2488860 RepID=A0A3N5DM44_9SPHN|nr:GNAT family N-acetyltransferase [Aurantiacibacter spongiae]RPF71905.1 N-acetyltransferase [Aurantiacibacter spongiae]
MAVQIDIAPVSDKAGLQAFIDLAYRLNADDPNWVPPLRAEVKELLTPGKNPFFEHAKVQLFLARRGGRVVGRISAHYDELALAQPREQGMGPGTGNWGMFEAQDEQVARALIERAEEWLREQGMTRVLAPISLSIWEEPGLLVQGHDHPPMVMMGHNSPEYQGWIEALGYEKAKSLYTYDLDVSGGFPGIVERIVKSGERSDRIKVRTVDLGHFDRDAAICIDILNDAWSDNWGFVPFTESEKEYGAKKLKPLILEGANMIAEVEGEPAAFMLALPDLNQRLIHMNGRLFPFNWARILWWLRNPPQAAMRVPLMGVVKKYQNTRLASQLAFMMIEYIRRYTVANHATARSEIGWVLDDNQGMNAIAEAIEAKINREYRLYDKRL